MLFAVFSSNPVLTIHFKENHFRFQAIAMSNENPYSAPATFDPHHQGPMLGGDSGAYFRQVKPLCICMIIQGSLEILVGIGYIVMAFVVPGRCSISKQWLVRQEVHLGQCRLSNLRWSRWFYGSLTEAAVASRSPQAFSGWLRGSEVFSIETTHSESSRTFLEC